MVDKIKALKLESIDEGGSEDDSFPTEANPNEDFLSAKGYVFEDLDSVRLEKSSDGYIQVVTVPTGTLKIQSPVPLIIALG